MNTKFTTIVLDCLLLTASLVSVRAERPENYHQNWPQWRGPTGNGVALHGSPPLEWSESKNIKWKVAIPGNGHATPVIWEDKIFILSAVPTARTANTASESSQNRNSGGRRGGFGFGNAPGQEFAFTTFCLDRATGKVLWEKVGRKEVPHQGKHETNSYSSGSPVTDGEHVISYFGSEGLYCYDMEGNLIWEKDLGKVSVRFGEGSSPALYDDMLIVVQDSNDDSYVYAFDKQTGNELWKKSRDEGSGWSTPYVLEHGGKTQVVVNATNAVRGYDLASGELLWECAGQTANAIPSVVADEQTVYAMSGFRGNTAVAIELGNSGNLTDTDAVRWKITRGTPYVPSPLLYDGLLYFLQNRDGIITCVDAETGEPHFSQERLNDLSGVVYASPVGVNNRIYLPGQNGNTVVLEKSNELKILATNELEDSFDASPAVVGDELFLRGHSNLYCIAEN